MSSSRVLGVGLAIALVAVIAGLSVWITSRVAHTRYQRLTALGVIAQRDNRGRVTQINLWPANMAAEGFERLPQLKHLKLLNLTGASVTADQLQYVEQIESLNELILVGTPVTDEGLARLASLKNLRRIVVTSTSVTSAGVWKLSQARPDVQIGLNPLSLHGLGHFVPFGGHGELDEKYELVALDLHDSAVTDDDLLPVLGCRQMRMVNLSGTRIGDAGLACLRNLEGVQELWLSGTNVSDEGLKTIVGFSQLKSISLARTNVSDAGMAQLESLTQLEVIHVGETGVSDDGLRHLRGLSHLREVYATASRVTTDGAEDLADAIPRVKVFGGAVPEKPVEEIESRVLG